MNKNALVAEKFQIVFSLYMVLGYIDPILRYLANSMH